MLDDAKDHEKLQLEVLELLLHHGADPNEIYTPVRFKASYQRFMPQMWTTQWDHVCSACMIQKYCGSHESATKCC